MGVLSRVGRARLATRRRDLAWSSHRGPPSRPHHGGAPREREARWGCCTRHRSPRRQARVVGLMVVAPLP